MIIPICRADGALTFEATVNGIAIYLDIWAIKCLAKGDASVRQRFVTTLRDGRVGDPFMGFDPLSQNGTSGAPSLVFSRAGSDAACATFVDRSVMLTFSLPPFAKNARSGTHCPREIGKMKDPESATRQRGQTVHSTRLSPVCLRFAAQKCAGRGRLTYKISADDRGQS